MEMFIIPILFLSFCSLVCWIDYLHLNELKRRKLTPKDISKDPFEEGL